MMFFKKNLGVIISLFVAYLICSSCGDPWKPNGKESKVVKVLDGRSVELQNGLKVQLLGVKESELSKKYLVEHVEGKTVVIVRDVKSNTPRETYKKMPKKIKAYLRIKGEVLSINGKLLQMDYCKLDMSNCKDSAIVFADYVKYPHPDKLYKDEELLTKIKPATFQILHSNGSLGTGFFINENGLAVTNNHVLSPKEMDAVCIFFGENGQLDTHNYRNIDRIVLTCAGEKIDFTVFQVRLDQNEKVPYLRLARNKQNDGIRVAKLGCPAGVVSNFQTGTLSNYNTLTDNLGNEYFYITHSCGTNNGDSGGPVVNFYAEVVGINQSIQFNEYLSRITGSAQKADGIAYAVDAVTIRRLLKENNIEYDK